MINIILVDDHRLVRTGIRSMLDQISGIKVVGEANTGKEAMPLIKQLQPDVVLMDIKMPEQDGLETTRKLLRQYPFLKIIIITAYENDVFPIHMLQAGALGYLTKNASKEEVVRAIRSVQVGQRHLSPEIAKNLALKSVGGDSVTPFDVLSERELQIVIMVTQGVKVQDIAAKLHLSSKTVNSYRYRIFDKLGVKSDVDLTHLALRYGILDSEDIK